MEDKDVNEMVGGSQSSHCAVPMEVSFHHCSSTKNYPCIAVGNKQMTTTARKMAKAIYGNCSDTHPFRSRPTKCSGNTPFLRFRITILCGSHFASHG